MDPARALADLTEISSQIRAAALLDGEGRVAASTLEDEGRAQEFARAARELLAAADAIRSAGGDALTQLEVATGEGSVFVVRDGDRALAATTSAEPTVGLVFYDLKSCLRSAAAEEPPAEEPKPKPKRRRKKADEAPAEDDAS
jgi:predicted regulator of Ras-like GTPase activity (Roadblock/LC7/MglB family)